MIGGATTSRAHTAVKIEPVCSHPVVHVLDASRAVGVAGKLLGSERQAFHEGLRAEYGELRARHEGKATAGRLIPLAEARENAMVLAPDFEPPQPAKPGVHAIHGQDLRVLFDYIDWTPFFQTWELTGRFPAILDDAVVGEQARQLHADALAMLERMAAKNWLEARAVYGLFPANRRGDDVVVWTDRSRTQERAVLHHIRQQNKKAAGRVNYCLADFVAPERAEGAAREDWIGAFAVTAGHGMEERKRAFQEEHDDYNAILLQALGRPLGRSLCRVPA